MSQTRPLSVLGGLALGLAPLFAQAQLDEIDQHRMLGIDRETGELQSFAFWEVEAQTLGVLKDADGQPMLGIDAAAYFPTFPNIYAMWESPADGLNKFVYVRADDGKATVVHEDVEGGRFTGATAFHSTDMPYHVFAVQHEKIQPPAVITGEININPNNSQDNQFMLETPFGTITRADLHEQAKIDTDGTLYTGVASRVRVQPKGNGNQNTVLLDGEPMTLRNSNTYTFAGEMEVRVYNDGPQSGRAMGQWYIQILDGTARLNDEVEVLSPHRLSRVSAVDGSVTELMTLSRAYNGLATNDGIHFFTHADGLAYVIDTAEGTETLLHEVESDASDLEFVGTTLQSYDTGFGTLSVVDHNDSGVPYSVSHLGLGELGAIMFHPRGFGPLSPSYD